MGRIAIDLSDRALAFASEGAVLSSAPSAVFDGGGHAAAGAPAWSAVRLAPTRVSSGHWRDLSSSGAAGARAVALVMAELRQRVRAHPLPAAARVWMAAPPALPTRSLDRLLGIADALQLPVEGFADAAVVGAAALGLDRPALWLDVGLHHVDVTALEAGGQLRRRGIVSSRRGGLIELYQAWLALIGRVCMRRSRFDPLHEAATEQRLFDALPRLARDAAALGEAAALIERDAGRLEISVTRDQLAEAGEPLYGEIVRLLHDLRPAGAPLALLVPRIALQLPGLSEALQQFHGCELIALADGFAAAALSLIDLPQREPGAPVRLLRRLPTSRVPGCDSLVERQLLVRAHAAAREPTHVLLGGRTYPLGRPALVIGRAPEASGIALPEGLAGVSRRHCTLVREGGETLLIDHSSFGTLVNGERVHERVRIHAGDLVRLGEPGIELTLIAVAGASASHSSEHHAAPAQN